MGIKLMNSHIGATMRTASFVAALCVLVLAATPAHAQFSLGLGGGTGFGSRGGTAKGGHANVSLELKLPILPGVRGDAYFVDAPAGTGKFAAAVSGVISAPIPVVTPYLIAGWGTYGLGGSGTTSGWNIGAGVRASVVVGPSVFAEVRRHQRVARDLITIGLRF